LKKINLRCPIRLDEPMSRHTTFRIGGPADALVAPGDLDDLRRVVGLCRERGIPLFTLGEGANILVADRGIRGVVLDTSAWSGTAASRGGCLAARAGTRIDALCREALCLGLSGLASFAAMPGSVGGSIWMNARCYEVSLSDRLESVEVLDAGLAVRRLPVRPEEFAYKVSPFQKTEVVILGGTFRLDRGDPARIAAEMEERRRDREAKGHFLFPCAGSVFKNDRALGQPSGRLIDALGLKGYSVGGAQVSPVHANIIVNRGGARAAEVLELIRRVEEKVRERYGSCPQREILLVGDWGDNR
jgi:UDP-N-acetylmuramate dehydrogenase